jgi:hypothetical protein
MAATGYVGGDPNKVSKAGDTMTGPLVLPGDPTSPLQAVDKNYADNLVSGGVADATTTSKGKVQLAGDLAGTADAPTVPALAGKVSSTRTITAGTGLSGGGDLSTNRTLSATDATTGAKGILQLAGDLAGTAAAPTVPALTGKVGTARQVLAGAGLSGGGDLSADRTLAVQFGTSAGTAAQGNDGRITGAVQASTATAKGDLLVATASATIARLGVGSDGNVLTADAASAGGVKWAAPSGGGGASGQDNIFPLSAYGLVAASGDPNEFQDVSGISANTIFAARCWVPAGVAINKLCAAVHTGGTYSTSSTPNQIALYDDTGAQVAITADDNTLWATAGWAARSVATIAAQGAGRWVYIAYIVGGYTGVVMQFPPKAADANGPWIGQNVNNSGNRRAFYLVGSSLPASFNPATAGTNTGFIPLVGAA